MKINNKTTTKNQTTTFITYNPEFFKQHVLEKHDKNIEKKVPCKSRAGKKFSSAPLWAKQMELEQKELDKVRSFKAIPISDEEFGKAMQKVKDDMKFDSDEELYGYLEKRWKDFCLDATMELGDNLTFGNLKFGYRLNLGNINYAIFDRMMTRNYQCIKEVVDHELRVGYDKHEVQFFKYHFLLEAGFPNLECDRWWRRDMFPDDKEKPFQFAQYKSITFVVNSRTNRVYCNWEMECKTMAIRGNEGQFELTV